jgi:hypothetical protein
MRFRVGAAALGLLLVGVTGYPEADARATTVEARIDSPANGAQVDGLVEIRGRATVSGDGRFAFYRILIGEGGTAVALRPHGPPYERPVENGVLATWDTDRFPSGEYLLTLRVYAADNSFESASAVVTVKYKPTPTPLAMLLPTPIDVPTLTEVVSAAPPPVVDAPPFVDIMVPTFDDGVPSGSVVAPVSTIAPARANVPIQPIPLDPTNPGPFAGETPTTFSPSQLPGNPAPVYITPIELNPPSY